MLKNELEVTTASKRDIKELAESLKQSLNKEKKASENAKQQKKPGEEKKSVEVQLRTRDDAVIAGSLTVHR